MSKSSAVGIVANPASARDIRRLVAHGSAMTAHDKINIVKRVMVGLGRAEVDRVIAMTDRSGVSAGLERASTHRSAAGWPALEFVEHQPTGTAADTVAATRLMVDEGVGAIVVLGGDGTHQLVAAECGTTPLVGISTGTNNAFPQAIEPTVAGLAAGLVATGAVGIDATTNQTKFLIVDHDGQKHRGLVDVAIMAVDRVGSGAVWEPSTISELYLAFARADGIGLSSIGGHLQPVDRHEPIGLALHLGPTGQRLTVPISPGLMVDIAVESWTKLHPDQPQPIQAAEGVVAIDGERMFRFDTGADGQGGLTVTLCTDGPLMIDVAATLDHAARAGVLSKQNR